MKRKIKNKSEFRITSVLLLSLIVAANAAQAGEPTGRWQGRWSSGTTGHSGPMRARVTPNTDGTYDALFTGRFAVVVPFVYRAQLQPVQTWNGTSYVVDKKLGPIMGSYRMNAIIPGNEFSANYSAAGDSGQIQMKRRSY